MASKGRARASWQAARLPSKGLLCKLDVTLRGLPMTQSFAFNLLGVRSEYDARRQTWMQRSEYARLANDTRVTGIEVNRGCKHMSKGVLWL